jgi:hypothetical protein
MPTPAQEKRIKVFPIPSDPRWCIYLDQDGKPTGEMGHICKGFKTGWAVMGLFTVRGGKPDWAFNACLHCDDAVPEDTKSTLRFIQL